MNYRRLGRSDLRISAIGLGCMGMSQAYGARDDAESARTLARALDLGVNFIDTADIYGDGHNEELIGKALAGRREQAVLASKFANVRTPDGGQAVDGRPEYVPRACEASLKRLGVEAIDLYYLHRVDPTVPIEDSVGAMGRLVEVGKVRHLGLSEASAATLRRAQAVHPIAALQTEYSLWSRDVEAEILPACRELAVTFVPYAPLGRGFLTGAIRNLEWLGEQDRRREMPRFQGANLTRQRGAARGARAGRAHAGLHGGPGRTRLAAGAGRRRRADPRHQAPGLSRGERGRGGDRAVGGRDRGARCGLPGGRGRRRALRAGRHAPGQPVTAADE